MVDSMEAGLSGHSRNWSRSQPMLVIKKINSGHFLSFFFCGGRNRERSTNGTALGRTFSSEPHQYYHDSILSTDKHMYVG